MTFVLAICALALLPALLLMLLDDLRRFEQADLDDDHDPTHRHETDL